MAAAAVTVDSVSRVNLSTAGVTVTYFSSQDNQTTSNPGDYPPLPSRPCVPLFDNNGSLLQLDKDQIATLKAYCKAGEVVVNVLVSLALTLGFPGNIIAFITTLTMKRSAFTLLLLALSAGDTLALVFKSVVFLNDHFAFMRLSRDANVTFLKVHTFASAFPNWILVLLCLERFVSIRFPFLKGKIFSVKKAAVYILVTVALVVIMFIISQVMATYNQPSHVLFDSICYSFLPVSLVAICSLGIGCILGRQHGKSRSSLGSVQMHQINRLDCSLTVMMFIAALTFLLLSSPICVVLPMYRLHLIFYFRSRLDGYIAFCVAFGLSVMSHAINCLLYFASNKQFREQLLKVFFRRNKSSAKSSLPSSRSNSTTLQLSVPGASVSLLPQCDTRSTRLARPLNR